MSEGLLGSAHSLPAEVRIPLPMRHEQNLEPPPPVPGVTFHHREVQLALELAAVVLLVGEDGLHLLAQSR